MASLEDILRLYDYELPRELIAQAPATPRDSARLLVYDRKTQETQESVFHAIGDFLPKRALLVLNETKVIPARLELWRVTSGMVSILVLGRAGEGIRVLANRELREGETLALKASHAESFLFTVEGRQGKEWLLTASFPLVQLPEILERFGIMPLPPYIKQTPLSPQQVREEYQSVFAREEGSIAAPTASLHFTDRLLRHLEHAGIGLAYVTLHVHLGTFAPLTEDQWKTGALHREEYHIHPHTIAQIHAAKEQGRPIIAVGTTVVRTLESAADGSGRIVRPSGTTNLFIREGYTFRIVDGLITNFHVPRSSLLMLVSALIGRGKVLELYREAVARRFRFFSFGDAMLLL